MSSHNALSLAVESLNRQEFAQAEDVCAEVLRTDPHNARAWHLRGIAHAQRGSLATAAECFGNAAQHDSENATYHYNLGLAYKELGQLDEAIAAYRQATARRPDFREARNNLGTALIAKGAHREAIACFRELAEMFPESSESHFNLANLLQDTGNFAEALAHYHRALKFDPDHAAARENLGRALTDLGRFEEARQVWTEWLQHQPNSAVARHLLASLSGETTPPRCEDAYLRETFDEGFAKNFDSQLARINYRAPELVGEALQSVGREMSDLEVLDIGCGTGLCGPIVRALAHRLVGVDLSADMLAEARKRGTYDETITAELTAFMAAHTQEFDLIISSDTLCYFGDLTQVLRAAFDCLTANGIFIFTVESGTSADDRPYELRQHGRYCHAHRYVTETLLNLGFSIINATPAVLRTEVGRPVDGTVFSAARPLPS